MNKIEPVLTKDAPAPIGPYQQAIKVAAGQTLCFFSGQIPLDPVSGQIVEGDVQAQAKRAFENLKAVVETAGASMETVVKTTLFLKSMGDFPKVNEIYATYFPKNPPARSTIEVARLPKDVLVEIEAVAVCR